MVDKKLEEIKKIFGPVVEVYPLVKQLELIDLRLLESSSSLARHVEIKNVTKINQGVNISFKRCDDNSNILIIYIVSVVGVSENRDEIIRITATYGEIYRSSSSDSFSDDAIAKFGQYIGLNTVWPYWREFVQSITTRMSLPPLTLPMIRPGSFEFTKDQKEQPPKKQIKHSKKKALK
jgi:preprotein translocase subunit SecB